MGGLVSLLQQPVRIILGREGIRSMITAVRNGYNSVTNSITKLVKSGIAGKTVSGGTQLMRKGTWITEKTCLWTFNKAAYVTGATVLALAATATAWYCIGDSRKNKELLISAAWEAVKPNLVSYFKESADEEAGCPGDAGTARISCLDSIVRDLDQIVEDPKCRKGLYNISAGLADSCTREISDSILNPDANASAHGPFCQTVFDGFRDGADSALGNIVEQQGDKIRDYTRALVIEGGKNVLKTIKQQPEQGDVQTAGSGNSNLELLAEQAATGAAQGVNDLLEDPEVRTIIVAEAYKILEKGRMYLLYGEKPDYASPEDAGECSQLELALWKVTKSLCDLAKETALKIQQEHAGEMIYADEFYYVCLGRDGPAIRLTEIAESILNDKLGSIPLTRPTLNDLGVQFVMERGELKLEGHINLELLVLKSFLTNVAALPGNVLGNVIPNFKLKTTLEELFSSEEKLEPWERYTKLAEVYARQAMHRSNRLLPKPSDIKTGTFDEYTGRVQNQLPEINAFLSTSYGLYLLAKAELREKTAEVSIDGKMSPEEKEAALDRYADAYATLSDNARAVYRQELEDMNFSYFGQKSLGWELDQKRWKTFVARRKTNPGFYFNPAGWILPEGADKENEVACRK